MSREISFEPIIFQNSTKLILGTFPSIKSIENSFYYGNPRNQFWSLLSETFQEKFPKSNIERVKLIKKYDLALWDICYCVTREENNSSDRNLNSIKPNDIPNLLKKYPNIEKLIFSSKKAYQIFQKYFKNLDIECDIVPSPSPAYQLMSYQEKLKEYKDMLK